MVHDWNVFRSDVYGSSRSRFLHVSNTTYYTMVDKEIIAENWSIPLTERDVTLEEAASSMNKWKLTQSEVPLIIQLVENPKYRLKWLFPGSVTLRVHDYAHILLGRGVLVKDEAFVIGFTMGSTARMTTLRASLFLLCARYMYPDGYRFYDAEAKIFRDGVRLAKIMKCKDLSRFDFSVCNTRSVSYVRDKVGLDIPLLRAYYEYEKKNNKESRECQRLI